MAQRGLNDNTRRQPTNPNPQDDAELFVLFLFFCSQALRHHVGCRTILPESPNLGSETPDPEEITECMSFFETGPEGPELED
jgi:hypothetical protein